MLVCLTSSSSRTNSRASCRKSAMAARPGYRPSTRWRVRLDGGECVRTVRGRFWWGCPSMKSCSFSQFQMTEWDELFQVLFHPRAVSASRGGATPWGALDDKHFGATLSYSTGYSS